ncbi:MAG: hypothetical protein NXH75_10035, partial [Halobacteriovoraceae bacterium]|nr:hypothetical protein [Halobacteriovoraceae bacterium]
KRFQFVRNDQGELQLVRDRSITMNFSIRPYLEFIKNSLKEEQALMASKADYDQQVLELFGNEQENFIGYGDEKSDTQAKIIVDSLRTLEGVDFDKVFNDSKFQEVIKKFEWKLSDALLKLDPTVLAHANDKDFFYQKRVTYQALTWALNFAKKRLSSVPILNTASYVLVRVEELVRQRRLYHQNMLLHYIEQVPESELGISHEEANHIMSSVYESRISWFAFWESQAAQANWDKFGVNKFFTDIRFNNNRFRSMRRGFDSVGSRLNYGFQDVVQEGENLVLNLFNTQHMFSSKLSVAYNRDKPQQAVRRRMVAQLAELGLSFLPLPSFIKGIGEDFIQSYYKDQVLMEGALYGHFEMNGDQDMLRKLRVQVLNPFETL